MVRPAHLNFLDRIGGQGGCCFVMVTVTVPLYHEAFGCQPMLHWLQLDKLLVYVTERALR